VLNVIRRSADLGFRVSQVPIRKRIRCPSEKPDESGAHAGTALILARAAVDLNGRETGSNTKGQEVRTWLHVRPRIIRDNCGNARRAAQAGHLQER
jgi:hypothetical protein